MINNDRIVPITQTDLLSAYSTMLALAGTSFTKISGDKEGNFKLASDASGNILCDAPVKSLDFSTASAAVVYFVGAYDFKEIIVNNAVVTPTGTVSKDVATLQTATLATGAVTIAKVG